ncbi:MFS transporter [Povalibacter sp.]|uniref:MFS transporter n=1 Tax=Povalibacter sp. TaxID=1962978 RepID=UPI002F40879F
MTSSVPQPSQFEEALMHKITWKLLPLLCLCFMAAFLDRVNVGFAREELVAELGMSNAVYGLGAGLFFIGYFLFEVPSNLILERVGARIWIARIMIVWGIVSACMMFVQSATSFYVLRFLLGAAEAGFFPGVIFYITQWFPAAYRSRTIAVFMSAAVLSGIVGGPLSGLLLQMDGMLGMQGYQWLFLIEAFPSIILGVIVFLYLPNGPGQARWLNDAERAWLRERFDDDLAQQGVAPQVPLLRALTDPRVLLLSLVYFLMVVSAYGLDFFMPTLLQQAFPDAAPLTIGWLAALPPLFALVVMVLYGRSSDRHGERRWHYAWAVWWAGAGLILASLPVPPLVAVIAMAIAVSGRWSSIAPFWGLSTAFLRGTAAAGAIALINSIGNLGGFAGPYVMGWLKDVTGTYEAGLRILAGAAFLSGALVMCVRRHAHEGIAHVAPGEPALPAAEPK